MQIAIISDTHGHIDDQILRHLEKSDEVWHAGDFGSVEVVKKIQNTAPLIGVYGNIDNDAVCEEVPLHQYFTRESLRIWMTHIGGKPGQYSEEVKIQLPDHPADLFVCGHSHILMVKKDRKNNWLYLNPGAAGHVGFHQVRTLLLLTLQDGQVVNPKVVELGKRGDRR